MMLSTQVPTSHSLIKTIDIDDVLTEIFNKKSFKWRGAKKLKIREKLSTFSVIGEGIWNSMREVKAIISESIENSIYYTAMSFLQRWKMSQDSAKAIDKTEAALPIVTRTADTEVCDSFYAALHLICIKYNLTPPIILYGRLFEDERFQYVSLIFGKRVFIVEMTTDNIDVQERACETMCALIRTSGGIPKKSIFVKIFENIAHTVAEIDLQNESFILCESVPDNLEILNLTEITALISASLYLSKKSRAKIEEICAETLFYKQPFLEGYYVNKNSVFGCVDPSSEKNADGPAQHRIILVYCDPTTQSNFLWNDKPIRVSVKQLMANVNCVTSKMPYQQLELLSTSVVSDSTECGGVRFGDQILYDGPLVIVLD